MVLTQQTLVGGEPVPQRTFPYHYGSYATRLTPAMPDIKPYCFHTTMVLTQQKVHRYKCTAARFPYHYGSYATRSRLPEVSLYHLFPYHYGSYATDIENDFDVGMQ